VSTRPAAHYAEAYLGLNIRPGFLNDIIRIATYGIKLALLIIVVPLVAIISLAYIALEAAVEVECGIITYVLNLRSTVESSLPLV
jgi:multisubunit Na+/H+ antiporter MnhE subunit